MSYIWGAASIQSNMSEGLLTWMNPKNDLQLAWEVGWERVDEPQYEIDLLYQRYFNPNFQAFAGYRLTNDGDAKDRGLIGINYRLPLMAWLNVSLDTVTLNASRLPAAREHALSDHHHVDHRLKTALLMATTDNPSGPQLKCVIERQERPLPL